MLELKIKRLHPDAILPIKATEKSGCWDIFALNNGEAISIEDQYIQYRTGIAVECPEGYDMLLLARSSITKYPLMLKNGLGYLDNDYKGEIFFRFQHLIKDITLREVLSSSYEAPRIYQPGDRIGQMRLIQRNDFIIKEVDELSNTQRGIGGFGSTGVK